MLMLRNLLMLGAVVALSAVALVGCSSPGGALPSDGSQVTDDWKAGLDEDVVTSLVKLSDVDRTAALTQRVCPVTDKQLGSMGTPPKINVEGREVFLCCDGCEDKLKSDPSKYLAKLKK